MPKITGNCMCGNVSFEADTTPAFIGNCHCVDCRKSSGAVYSTFVFVPKSDVTFKGEPGTYDHTADSGNVLTKHFCKDCGSPMYTENTARGGMIGLRAGIINEDDVIAPQINVYAGSRLASTPLNPDLPAPDKMPG